MRSTKTVLRNLNSKKGACEMREKSQVEDIDRSIYDIRDEEKDAYRMKEGLTPQIVEQLSKEKGDPAWMQQFRLESLQIYNEMPIPDWGPSIEGLDMDLWKSNEIVLRDAGILPEHLAVTNLCTCCNPNLLFSHRASHGKRGNLGAFLKLV